MITLENVIKEYDAENKAVKNFNLSIQDGEFIVLVGPSGCGKTTTLRMIAGLETITKGKLIIDGKISNDMHPKDRNLAMVFQNYALYPHMTVFENIAYPLKLQRVEKSIIQKKVQDIAELLDIKEYLNRKPKSLSGGQKQRVALGRCIIRSPKAFLMDEPLSNLDAQLRVQMRTEIIRYHQKLQKTFIYVTHDQVEAMTMGDRIVVMNQGEIQQIGTPKELYNHPTNRFVAEFIGSPSMNFLSFQNDTITLNQSACPRSISAPVEIGFRPEKVQIGFQENAWNFSAKVLSVEPLGAENYVTLDVNDQTILLRDFTLQSFDIDKIYQFFIHPKDLYFFDPKTKNLRDIQ